MHNKKVSFNVLEELPDEADLLAQLQTLKKKIRDLSGPSGQAHEKEGRKGDRGKKTTMGPTNPKSIGGGAGLRNPSTFSAAGPSISRPSSLDPS